ncbi:MAG: RNA polymerase sigma factor, partial [Amphiplicatus sp.]
ENELRRYLSRFFSRPQDIEDLVQEAFLRVFATSVRTKVRSPRKLLFKAAKHSALNALARKAHKTTEYIEDFKDSSVFLDESQIGPEAMLDSKKKLMAFSQAVASLPPACREVFILRKFDGLSQKEIAARLNISISGVEKHIAAGTVKCSRYLRDLGYEPGEFGGRKQIRNEKAGSDQAPVNDKARGYDK